MRKVLFLILCFLALPAYSMDSFLMVNAGPSTSLTQYASFNGVFDTFSGSNYWGIIPITGTVKNLTVKASAGQSGAGTYVLTLVKNLSNQSLAVTVSGAGTTFSDTTHTFSVTAGDRLTVQSAPSGSPDAVTFSISITITAAPNISLISFGGANSTPSTSATNYSSVFGSVYAWGATESNLSVPVATSGTFKNLYLYVTFGGPGSGKSYVFTVMKNGVATALTCTMSNTSQTCSDTSNSFTVIPGDQISLRSVPSGTPTALIVGGGIEFDPVLDGESIMGGIYGSFSAAAVNYAPISSNTSSGSATETGSILPRGLSLYNLFISVGTAPGSGKNYVRALRVNSATSSLSATILDTATTANDLNHVVKCSVSDLVNFISTPSGTPATSTVNKFGIVINTSAGDKLYGAKLYDSKVY